MLLVISRSVLCKTFVCCNYTLHSLFCDCKLHCSSPLNQTSNASNVCTFLEKKASLCGTRVQIHHRTGHIRVYTDAYVRGNI